MNKKMLKRTAALSTLVAVSLCGTVAAQSVQADTAADCTIGGTYETSADFMNATGFKALAAEGYTKEGVYWHYCNYYPDYVSGESNHVATDADIIYKETKYGGDIGILGAYSGKGANATENPSGNVLDVKHNITAGGNVYLFASCINGGADAKWKDVAKDNTTNVDGVTIKAGSHVFIGGALSNSGSEADANYNTATVKNVTFDMTDGAAVCIYGGESRGGDAIGNTAIVENVTAGYSNIFGGFSWSANGDASENTVTLNNVTLGEDAECAGGLVLGVEGNADKNIFNINGGKVAGVVYGGYADNGTASDNIINVSGNADIADATLSGDNGGAGTGNTLNLVEGWTGKEVGAVENFNVINVAKGVEANFTQGIGTTEDMDINAQEAMVNIIDDADSGDKAVVYAADGATLNIAANASAGESLGIVNEGSASSGAGILAKGAVNGTVVNIGGNVDIDANGGRGIKAENGYGSTDTSATINLGDDTTKKITVSNGFIGLGAHYNGSQINVEGDELIVDASTGYGIYAMNGTTEDTDLSDNASVIISEDTVATINMADGSYGAIAAQSQGSVEIKGDLYVSGGEIAVTARGNSNVKINEANRADTTVQLDGDIDFAYDAQTSGTPVDATVIINLANEDSYLNGNIFVSGDDIPEGYEDVTGMNLGLANGAQWTTDGDADSFVNTLTMDNGIINQASTGEITIDNLSGEGNVVFANDNSGQVNVLAAKSGAKLNLSMAGVDADRFNSVDDLNTIATKLDAAESAAANLTGNVYVAEGLINGEINMIVDYQDLDGDGRLNGIIRETVQRTSTTVTAVSGIAANAAVAWRDEDATLSQRLGELRDSEGDQGVWARFTQGEFERGGDFETEYNMFQIGYDKAKDDWHYGAAVSHSEGDTTYSAGSGEISSTSFSAYGTWLGDKGHYKDIVAKIGVIDNEYTINAAGRLTKGDYDTVGTSISGEYGMKNDMGDGWYVTPLAKMTYMHIGAADYTTNNGINVKHKSVDSLIARLGVELGKQLGAKGDVYVKASALHDFAGDADTVLRLGNNRAAITDEIGGTWYEVGLGFNYKTSDATYLYADVIKTYGDEIRTPWQWNVGARYSF